MLFLVTSAPAIHPGIYSCREISAEDAGAMIKERKASDDLQAFVFHGSAGRALNELTGIKFPLAKGKKLPILADGDEILEIRVSEEKPAGRPSLGDLLFFHIEYSKQTI